MKWSEFNPGSLLIRKRQPATALLALSLEGSTLAGVEVRRTNGSVEVKHTFCAPLSLDPLTGEPDLVGREIRKLLDAEGVRERACVLGLPAAWALQVNVKLPELSEADLASFLDLEAERGFPTNVEGLVVAQSRYRTPGGDAWATLLGVSRQNVDRLDAVLRAAQLRPLGFGLGIAALPRHPGGGNPEGASAALFVAGEEVTLQFGCGAGVVALRIMDVAGHPAHDAAEDPLDQLARDIRISLGQLPQDLRDGLRTLSVIGRGRAAEELAAGLRSRLSALDLAIEHEERYAAGDLALQVTPGSRITPELGLAVQYLANGKLALDFLPPKISKWQQLSARYSSQKLMVAGATAGAVAALVLLAFGIQQAQLAYWRGKWNGIKARVTEVERLNQENRKLRPWFDDSFRSLTILRRLTEAFPEDGSVSAKTVTIRELTGPQEGTTVTCSGTARSNQALIQTIDRLRTASGVKDLLRGPLQGGTPLQFTFSFRWEEKGAR
ncbi:MAG: hypothetical protein IPM17_05985 [Verrucomicrobia bacterium]|nr:hypothetical protein [Verrucomicrobiota bacterium]